MALAQNHILKGKPPPIHISTLSTALTKLHIPSQVRKNIMHFSTAAVLTALASVPLASTLGINCRGSGGCIFGKKGVPQHLYDQLLNNGAPMWTTYMSGQKIVCDEGTVNSPSEIPTISPSTISLVSQSIEIRSSILLFAARLSTDPDTSIVPSSKISMESGTKMILLGGFCKSETTAVM